MKFGTMNSLQSHVKCINVSTKNFTLSTNLKQHFLIVHEGKKDFECEICGSKFGFKSRLDKHVLHVHEVKDFECEICGSKFGFKSGLNKHVACVHEGL